MAREMIRKDILIEDLVRELPDAVTYLMEQGIRCLRCGEPVWGTLESSAKEKGFSDSQIERFTEELNALQHVRHEIGPSEAGKNL